MFLKNEPTGPMKIDQVHAYSSNKWLAAKQTSRTNHIFSIRFKGPKIWNVIGESIRASFLYSFKQELNRNYLDSYTLFFIRTSKFGRGALFLTFGWLQPQRNSFLFLMSGLNWRKKKIEVRHWRTKRLAPNVCCNGCTLFFIRTFSFWAEA